MIKSALCFHRSIGPKWISIEVFYIDVIVLKVSRLDMKKQVYRTMYTFEDEIQ